MNVTRLLLIFIMSLTLAVPFGATTPLHDAVYQCNVVAIEKLIAGGADPNVKYERHETSLHLAYRKPHGAVVQALLDAGAAPGRRSCLESVTGWGAPGGLAPEFRTDQDHPVVAAWKPEGA